MPHISPPSSMLNREQEPATGTEPSSAETTLGDSFAALRQRMEERHAAAELQLPQKFDAVEASLIREIRHRSPPGRSAAARHSSLTGSLHGSLLAGRFAAQGRCAAREQPLARRE